MGWLDHGGLGFNYRLSDLAAALGVAQLERLDSLLSRRDAVASLYASGGSPALEGFQTPIVDRGEGVATGSSTSSACPTTSTATRRSPAWPSAASPARPTCPASTSSRTCASSATARASSRSPKRPLPHSLALPFFPAMSEGQVDRVCQELGAALDQSAGPGCSHAHVRFRKDPDPRFWALNRSIEFDWRLAPYDIDQSQAHARGLLAIGVLDEDELESESTAGAEPGVSAIVAVRRQELRRRSDSPLVWRITARRLEAEAARDSMLAISGK